MSQRPPVRINLKARAANAELRRAKTRERLLSAAETVIADKGLDAASIEDFVDAAGVSRGTFYNYFPTTTALIHAMNSRVAEGLDRMLDSVGQEPEDPAVRLATALHIVLASYTDDPVRGWVALQIAGSRAPRQKAFEDRFARIYAQAVGYGRFRPVDMAAAWTIAFGALRMAQRDIVSGVTGRDQTVQIVALVLCAFGVTYYDAERISRVEAENAWARRSALA